MLAPFICVVYFNIIIHLSISLWRATTQWQIHSIMLIAIYLILMYPGISKNSLNWHIQHPLNREWERHLYIELIVNRYKSKRRAQNIGFRLFLIKYKNSKYIDFAIIFIFLKNYIDLFINIYNFGYGIKYQTVWY